MDLAPHRELIAGRVRVLQLIAAICATGVLAFLAIAVALPSAAAPLAGRGPGELPLTYVGLLLTMLTPVLTVVARRASAAKAVQPGWAGSGRADRGPPPMDRDAAVANRAQLEAQRVAALLQRRTVQCLLVVALVEGPALVNVMAYLVERQVFSAALAGGLALVLFLQMPTRERVETWLEGALRAAA